MSGNSASDSNISEADTVSDSDFPRRKPFRRRILKIGLMLLISYLALVIMLGLLQRWLIYHPCNDGILSPDDSGLPNGQVHAVSIETDDGLILHGWHILPSKESTNDSEELDARLSNAEWAVIYFHGNAGNRRHRVDYSLALNHHNAHVILFDYRGYGNNPGKPTEEHLHQDALKIWEYVTRERGVPAERILLYGESLGGGVATELAARLCDRGTSPGGLILTATFSSLVDAAKHHYPILPVNWILQDRYESVSRIPDITCSYLHIHGDQDTIVPLELGRKLFAAAPEKSDYGLSRTFVELPGIGHNNIAPGQIREAVGPFVEQIRKASKAKHD